MGEKPAYTSRDLGSELCLGREKDKEKCKNYRGDEQKKRKTKKKCNRSTCMFPRHEVRVALPSSKMAFSLRAILK